MIKKIKWRWVLNIVFEATVQTAWFIWGFLSIGSLYTLGVSLSDIQGVLFVIAVGLGLYAILNHAFNYFLFPFLLSQKEPKTPQN